jgi:hypothetical protein
MTGARTRMKDRMSGKRNHYSISVSLETGALLDEMIVIWAKEMGFPISRSQAMMRIITFYQQNALQNKKED